MSVVSTKFKCDRDNVEIENASGGPPVGWAYINVSPIGALPVQGNLCPACLAAFQTFMGQVGGSFSLSLPDPQTPAPAESPATAEAPVVAP